jgi:predicted  nucleic acid-binding Zn-ribbon protein
MGSVCILRLRTLFQKLELTITFALFDFDNTIQLTNTLQKKLDEVRKEKALLQEQIEYEKKSHATLQTQLSGLRDSHLSVAEALEEEEEIEEEA